MTVTQWELARNRDCVYHKLAKLAYFDRVIFLNYVNCVVYVCVRDCIYLKIF